MSKQQHNDVQVVLVDHEVVDVVRAQSLVTLEANHHYFEEVESFGAPAREALAKIYRDAFATLDAIGWGEAEARGGAGVEGAGERGAFAVPLTAGHVEQLRARRFELGHANIDRVERLTGWTIEDLEPAREAGKALDRLFSAWRERVAAG